MGKARPSADGLGPRLAPNTAPPKDETPGGPVTGMDEVEVERQPGAEAEARRWWSRPSTERGWIFPPFLFCFFFLFFPLSGGTGMKGIREPLQASMT